MQINSLAPQTHGTTSSARFAMNRLEFGVQEAEINPLSAPPYEISQDCENFNVLFNMQGIPPSKIKFGLDTERRRITIFAEREQKMFTDQFLWVFSLPDNADLDSMETDYMNGLMQVKLPRCQAVA